MSSHARQPVRRAAQTAGAGQHQAQAVAPEERLPRCPSRPPDRWTRDALLRQRIGRPVVAACLCPNTPAPAEAVRALRAAGHRRVAVARRLMAPGHVARRAQEAGGCLVSAPLGAHPDVARLVPKRFDEAAVETARGPAEAATRTV
ncbi:hypothetical protein [Streptomyces sp. NPDC048295]|uniref:hypothetical protein n=1 Tax=Streptomyces sp. NPDC048295 TaxID=3154617 RepID=UPI00341A026E